MKKLYLSAFMLVMALSASAQGTLTLGEAINIAREHSPMVEVARLSFMSRYWNYRSYRAQLLPSLSLSGTLGSYNRSLVQVQNYETGDIRYVENQTLSNTLGLNLKQNIPFTGGTLSLNTNLYRLDQFSNRAVIYNSNPITINYTQPLRAYNKLKWQKKTAPLEYEKAKRELLEATENITLEVTSLFFALLSRQMEYEKTLRSAADNRTLYDIARKRQSLGMITRSELMQLRLAMLNSEVEATDQQVLLDAARYDLCAYLGLGPNAMVELEPPMDLPELRLDFDRVLRLALDNSSFLLQQELNALEAAQNVAQAKAQKGLQATFSANLGLSQTADKLGAVYRNLKDQEIVSITLTMPIFDWNMSRGRLKMAQAEERLARTEAEQKEQKYRQDILLKVLKFNNQARQCEVSRQAMELAEERYGITVRKFEVGSITVSELNTALEERKNALVQYLNQLQTFWSSYYEIRKITLYDFFTQTNLCAEFDKIVQ